MRRNPDADGIDIAAAKHRRAKEIADAQRTERVHFLRQLQRDLAHLRAVDELGERAADQLDSLITSGSPADTETLLMKQASAIAQQRQQQQQSGAQAEAAAAAAAAAMMTPSRRSVTDGLRQAEIEAQRLAWLTYTGQIDDNPTQQQKQLSAIVGSASLLSPPPPGPGEIAAAEQQQRANQPGSKARVQRGSVSSPVAGGDLPPPGSRRFISGGSNFGELARRGWADAAGVWHASTDRHENAATCMQCAFRSFVARARAAERRRLRARAIQKVMQAEAALERAWVTATTVKDRAQALAAEMDRTIRVMEVFTQRFKAVLARRRQRKIREAEVYGEVAEYAATRIQALVRGFLARRRVAMVRYPDLAAAKRALVHDKAATRIQRIVRGRLARAYVARRMHAATRIQATYRRHLCLFRAGQARRQRRVYADAELADFAARTIQSFMRSLVVRRRRSLRKYRHQVLLMQSVGRAYAVRRAAAARFHLMVDEAATDIQRMFRGWYARNHYVSGLVTAHRSAMEQALQQHAACIVTRAFRRAKIFGDKRSELLRAVAATEIQRTVRGRIARRHYRAMKEGEQAALVAQMRDNAAVIIQSAWRGYVARKAYFAQTGRRVRPATRPSSAKPKTQQQQQQQQQAAPPAPPSTAAATAGTSSSSAASTVGAADNKSNKNEAARRAAASVIQRFYRRRIRRPKLAVFVRKMALRVQHFLASVKPRRALALLRSRGRERVASSAEPAAQQSERVAAVGIIVQFLRRRVALRAAYRSERAIGARKRNAARAEEAGMQEREVAATAVQRCVRGYLIRRYMLLIAGLERSRIKRAAALEEMQRAAPHGVTTYEAACALQQYFLKHADKSVPTPQPPQQHSSTNSHLVASAVVTAAVDSAVAASAAAATAQPHDPEGEL